MYATSSSDNCYTDDMNTRLKRILILAAIGLVIVTGAIFFFRSNSGTAKTVRIVEYGLSICTQDIPTSACGPYDVTVQTADGQKATYTVAGFDNRDSKRYDDIGSKIAQAKKQNAEVTITTNSKGEITSVQ